MQASVQSHVLLRLVLLNFTVNKFAPGTRPPARPQPKKFFFFQALLLLTDSRLLQNLRPSKDSDETRVWLAKYKNLFFFRDLAYHWSGATQKQSRLRLGVDEGRRRWEGEEKPRKAPGLASVIWWGTGVTDYTVNAAIWFGLEQISAEFWGQNNPALPICGVGASRSGAKRFQGWRRKIKIKVW